MSSASVWSAKSFLLNEPSLACTWLAPSEPMITSETMISVNTLKSLFFIFYLSFFLNTTEKVVVCLVGTCQILAKRNVFKIKLHQQILLFIYLLPPLLIKKLLLFHRKTDYGKVCDFYFFHIRKIINSTFSFLSHSCH